MFTVFVALMALLATFSPLAGAFADPQPARYELTYEQAMGDAQRFHALLALVPEDRRATVASDEDLENWTLEVVPFFAYEGVTSDDATGGFGGPVYPAMTFEYYQEALLHNHVLGRALVFGDEISLNARHTNPVSSWYGRTDALATLIHELAHAQGVKFPAPHSNIDHEASAQLVMLEVLSALVNNGNELALAPLLEELYYMNLSAARYVAIRDGYEERFLADRASFHDAFEMANFEKSDRFWARRAGEGTNLSYILEVYNYDPLNALHRGLANEDRIYGVKLPINSLADMILQPSGGYPYDGMAVTEPEVANHISYNQFLPLPLIVDDFHYAYDNAESLAVAVMDEATIAAPAWWEEPSDD